MPNLSPIELLLILAGLVLVTGFLIPQVRNRLKERVVALINRLTGHWQGLEDLFPWRPKTIIDTEPPPVARRMDYKLAEPRSVDFSVVTPLSVGAGQYFIIDVWAYLKVDYSAMLERAKQLGRSREIGGKSGVPVSIGSLLTVELISSILEVDDPTDFMTWEGEPVNASFMVRIPQQQGSGHYPAKVLVKAAGLPIARIPIVIQAINGEVSGEKFTYSHNYPIRNAFASYASDDRAEVLSRVQGMKKMVPNLDIFIDVFSLRSGDNWAEKLAEHVPSKDAFFLFWSAKAAESEWVDREWNMALDSRGLDYIEPVPLEEPDVVPPPERLKSLHFNDAYLGYIKHQQSKSNR